MQFCEKFCSRTPGAGQQLLFLLTSFAVICFFVVKFYLRSAHDSWGVPDQLFFDNQTLHWSRCAPKSRGAPDQMQSFDLTRDKVHCRGAAPDSGSGFLISFVVFSLDKIGQGTRCRVHTWLKGSTWSFSWSAVRLLPGVHLDTWSIKTDWKKAGGAIILPISTIYYLFITKEYFLKAFW